jgi:hypothetical protein
VLAEFTQETLTSPTPAAPVTNVGATGKVAAVSGVEASEHPIALQALRVKEYSVPDDRPVLLYDVEVEEIEAETRVAPRRSSKRVIGEPLLAGAVQATRTELVVAVFNVMVGASGAVAAATGETGRVNAERTPPSRKPAERTRNRGRVTVRILALYRATRDPAGQVFHNKNTTVLLISFRFGGETPKRL